MSLCFYFSLPICKIYIPFVLFKSCLPPELQLAYIETNPNGLAHFWGPSRADLAASMCLYSWSGARGQVNERCRMYWAWTHEGKCPLMAWGLLLLWGGGRAGLFHLCSCPRPTQMLRKTYLAAWSFQSAL